MDVDGSGGQTGTARPAGSLLCPELVGRAAELRRLTTQVEALAEGRGGVVVLVGEAGTGKSRLLEAAVGAAGSRPAAVLSGRAVPGPNPVPYRPLTEAFLAAFRSAPPPDDPQLAGFGGHLGRLVPSWRTTAPGGAEESPLLLGEAVVRLLRPLGGALLLLEDLHWADAETLAVLDYLGDALRDEAVLCLATSRPSGAADEVLERLRRRDPRALVPVEPLAEPEVRQMVEACLGTTGPPPPLARFLATHSDGVPLLVEELLAGLVAARELAPTEGRWATRGALTPTVPASLRDSVRRRLAELDPTARRVVAAAALLGRHFDWELLPGVAEVDGRAAVEGLRDAVAQQLVAVDGGRFTFRHALTREAVLDDLLPPEVAHLAGRAWPAVERAHPGLPGPTCELAAELAEAAGEPVAAAVRLLESARRALAAGALTSAETTARRARQLAGDDGHVVLDADEVLVRVLVAAGQPRAALDLGRGLVARMADTGTDAARRATLLVTLARAGLAAGDDGGAARDAEAARAVGGDRVDEALAARVDAVAAHVALEQARLDDAAALAGDAVRAARATDQPAVECEALEVLGRVARVREPEHSQAWFRAEADTARRAGLPDWHLRAQHELAIQNWDPAALRRTRDLADHYGALVTVAVMDLSLADLALGAFDRDGALEAAEACATASRRYGLATEPVAHLWLAGAHALADDETAMHTAIERALAPDPTDPRILGDLYGRVLATHAFVRDDLDTLRGHLDTMIEHARAAPASRSVFPGRALWATVHAAEDDDLGAAARAEYAAAAARIGMTMFTDFADAADAVALGRAGDAVGATALMHRARTSLRGRDPTPGFVHCQQLLVAAAAIRDGWGDPVAWLRESEAFFAAGGYGRIARRCRLLLAAAGSPVPRRGRGDSTVPPSLRALGVTSREVDVLKLVAAGLSNREIGARLYLSPKTVERHLASLFDRAGVRDRRALVGVARAHGVEDG